MSKHSIKEIKSTLESTPIMSLKEVMNDYLDDERQGVQRLLKTHNNRIEKHLELINKFEEMSKYENAHYDLGKSYIGGVDEVGRGPLAGPVVAAVVILPRDVKILGLDDSKKVPEKKREQLYDEIIQKAVAWEVGIVDVETIDEINILQSTYKAMRQAINKLSQKPDIILVDAVTIPELAIEQEGIIKGDSKSISIAAASIVAKVTRDRMMVQYAELFPQYDLASNKGYGTEKHVQGIKKFGLSPIHRKTFTKNIV